MARYLNEREVGFDALTIGFPNIGDCMGVVLQTDMGLFGFHAMPGDADRASAFQQFISNHGGTGTPVHLYGTCIRSRRCNGQLAQWQSEMQKLAGILGYQGTVSGFDLPFYKPGDATYVEYRRNFTGGTCAIYYKRMSKMKLTDDPEKRTVNPVERIVPKSGTFTTKEPAMPVVMTADIVKTYWNKGELHPAKATEIDTFTV